MLARFAVLSVVLLLGCSSDDEAPPREPMMSKPEEGCEGCPCFSTNRGCQSGLSCDNETFEPPVCVPEEEFQRVTCISTAVDQCGCYMESGLKPTGRGCGDEPSPWGGEGEYLCCGDEGWPEEGNFCQCVSLATYGEDATCDDTFSGSLVEVEMCNAGTFAPPSMPSGGGGSGAGGSSSGGGSSGECDPAICNGIDSTCSDGFCIYCSSACTNGSCETQCT